MTALRRFFRLPRASRLLVLEAFAWLFAVRLAMVFLSVASIRRRLCVVPARRAARMDPRDAAWAIDAAAARFPWTHCLARSLALHAWLSRSGLPSELVIGVAKSNAGLQAHAWVRCGGMALDDEASLAGFEPFAPLSC